MIERVGAIHAAPKPPPREKKPRKPLPNATKTIARSAVTKKGTPSLKRGGKPKAVNPVAKAKRNAKFKKYLGSAAWKKLRLAVFVRDGFRCTAQVAMFVDEDGDPLPWMGKARCWNRDETETGKGLVCDHKTYARFGHENLDDLRTLCAVCNRIETVEKRANWKR